MRYVMCFLLMNRCNNVEGDGVELYDIKSEFKGCLFMNLCVGKRTLSRGERLLLTGLHWLVLIASAALVAWITRDTLQGNVFILSRNYMRFQFGVCLLFQLDILVEWCYAPKKWNYICKHLFFILISIPYLNLVGMAGIHPSSTVSYFLCFLPMVRAAFVLAMITGALTESRAMSTFYVYLIWVSVSLFFVSLMFYEGEHYINPQVDTFWTAFWWACMSMSTAGCYVTPVTVTGTVLEVFLSAEGMMLIPVFTVYITKVVLGTSKQNVADKS